jgi:hypothetical protein
MPNMSRPRPVASQTVSLVKRTDRQAGRGPGVSRLSNAYLQDDAKLVVFLKLQQYVATLCLCLLLLFLANFSSTNYRVFATSEESKLNAPPPVDQELNDNVVSMWVVDAVLASTTMGFHDYDLRLQEIRPYFTDRGWESFNRYLRTAYNNAPSVRSMIDNDRLLMWSSPRTPPQIVQKGLVGGVMTYQVKQSLNVLRMLVTSKRDTRVTIEVVVERVRPEINPSGLAIAQWRYADEP